MPPTYEFHCKACGMQDDVVCSIEARDTVKPDWACCETPEWTRALATPAVLGAIFLDKGHRERMDPGYAAMKEASKLEKASMNLPQNQRTEINREIKKLKAVKK